MIYCIEKNQYTQSGAEDTSTAESVYVAHFDYQAMYISELSFSKGEQLEISRKSGFWWRGRSLVSGDEGDIPSICVQYNSLESLQLFLFVMEEEVSLPVFQKIRNNLCSNDDTVSLFLKTINDDPILIEALRQDKMQHEGKGKTVYKIIVTVSYYYVLLFFTNFFIIMILLSTALCGCVLLVLLVHA